MFWEAVAWIGTALIIVSRLSFIEAGMQLGFICAALGSFCWAAYGFHRRIWSLVVVDGVMLLLDIAGTLRWS